MRVGTDTPGVPRLTTTRDELVNVTFTVAVVIVVTFVVGDIGLIACKVQETEDSEQIEGYHVLVGGGFGPDAALARDVYRDVKAENAPQIVERMLKAYTTNRASPDESFLAFARRHDVETLKIMFDAQVSR